MADLTKTLAPTVVISEFVNAQFHATDADQCQVELAGIMTLNFPNSIISVLEHDPKQQRLRFHLRKANRLEVTEMNNELLHR